MTTGMDTKIIGSKIASARKKANMSQAQLAQQLFISPQAVGKWERGESIPDIITINRLAEILGDASFQFSAFSGQIENEETDRQEETDAVPDAQERPLLNNFSGSNLAGSDLAGVTAHQRKFHSSALRGSDFSGADLTGSSFSSSDAREANFDGADLTDCILSVSTLDGASFNKTNLTRTEFNKCSMGGAKFTNALLKDTKLTMIDFRKTTFDNCSFNGVDFTYSDFRGVSLDGQTFTGVKFDKAALDNASFKGATLKNVSFKSSNTITNKYYRAIKTINFEGAMIDKLTYAALKGLGAELEKATVI